MKVFSTILLAIFSILVQAQVPQGTLLGTWDDPALPGSAAYNNTYNEVWGVAVNGREFAILGSTMGTHYIDVTDPTNPVQVAFVPGKATGSQIIHRDYDTYQNYIFGVCDEGPSSLQIMDISGLPDTVVLVNNSDSLITRAHNGWIDTATARFYALSVAGGAQGYQGMKVFDISDPVHPQFLWGGNVIEGFAFSHVHDAFVRNDTAYLNCGNNGLCVADFSDPANPKLIGTMTSYAGQGYNHSGWLSADGLTYYMADETHGSPMKAVDVSDFEDINLEDAFDAESTALQIVHNPVLACNLVYVAYYYDGLQVFDVSDPTNVQHVMYYPTSTEVNTGSYMGAWGAYPLLPSGNILVSDMQNGLFVVAALDTLCNKPPIVSGTVSPKIGQFVVSPQPSTTDVLVTLDFVVSGSVLWQLTDLSGRVVLSGSEKNRPTWNISVNQVVSGLYALRLQLPDGQQLVQKVAIFR